MNKGFLKLHRKILDWEWYTDIPTKTLFIHLLLKANIENKNWQGNKVKKGQLITSVSNLSIETGLTQQQVRTALKKLEKTEEIINLSTNKYRLITLVNYGVFNNQEITSNNQVTNNQQSSNNQVTNNQQSSNNQITNNQQSSNNQITNNQQSSNNQITTTKEPKELKEVKELKELKKFSRVEKTLPDSIKKKFLEFHKSHYEKTGFTLTETQSMNILNQINIFSEHQQIGILDKNIISNWKNFTIPDTIKSEIKKINDPNDITTFNLDHLEEDF